MVDRTRCASIVLVVVGLGFIIGSALLFILESGIIESAVKKGCELKPNTTSYLNWRHPPVPLHISFYVFNITNADALNQSAQPAVQQIGPFVYKEVRTKVDVEQYQNGTLSYRELRSYEFLPELSVANPNKTIITTMNLVYMTLANYLQGKNVSDSVTRGLFDLLATKDKPTMQHNVHEFLWNYKDPLLAWIKRIAPSVVLSEEVSIYNTSASGAGLNTFLINDGVNLHGENPNRIKHVGNIEGFNGQSTVSYWSSKYANMINGTDSTLWHPGTQTDDEVYIFSSDICRSIRLEFQEKVTNTYGIDNYRFQFPVSTFYNDVNEDFCLNTTKDNKTYHIQCLPNGLMPLSTCIKTGSGPLAFPLPIIASSPHFLDANSSVQSAVKGMQPDERLHRSFMEVEPLTGTVMNGSRRMQINLNVVNNSEVRLIANYQPCVFPMMWLEEHAEIDQARADEFHSAVRTPITILDAMKYLTLSIGIVLFLIVIYLIVRNHQQMNSSGSVFAPPPDETSPLCS